MGNDDGRILPQVQPAHKRSITMMNHVATFMQDQEGATALEYGLLAALIAAVIVGAVTALGDKVRDTFSFIEGQMPSVGS